MYRSMTDPTVMERKYLLLTIQAIEPPESYEYERNGKKGVPIFSFLNLLFNADILYLLDLG